MAIRIGKGLGPALLLSVLWTSSAHAHLTLTSPPPRLAGSAGGTQLKIAPCGQNQNGRTQTVSEFSPGETITVEWDEYVNHPSYYRIAFDVDGDDDFPVRTDMDSVDPETDDPESVHPIGDVVLAYVYEEPDMPTYSVEVTLPNVQCENCTLQVIQFMYDKVGNDSDDEYYFQCADVALRGELTGTGGDSGSGGSPSGGSSGSGGEVASGGVSADGGAGSGAAPPSGGTGSGGMGTGGVPSTDGGGSSLGGTTATGGVLVATGGNLPTGGTTPGAGGTTATGGATGGASPAAGADVGGCTLGLGVKGSAHWLGLLLALAAVGRGRRHWVQPRGVRAGGCGGERR